MSRLLQILAIITRSRDIITRSREIITRSREIIARYREIITRSRKIIVILEWPSCAFVINVYKRDKTTLQIRGHPMSSQHNTNKLCEHRMQNSSSTLSLHVLGSQCSRTEGPPVIMPPPPPQGVNCQYEFIRTTIQVNVMTYFIALRDNLARGHWSLLGTILRWFIGDFTLTPQYFASSLSVNCHDSQFHRLPTMKFALSLHKLN